MLIINNKALKITNKWLNPVAGSGPTPPTYYHVYTSATNGTITAVPISGISGTTVTLSNTPDTGYEFDSYSITGATLYDTNKFDINNSDVNVVGNFIQQYDPYNPLDLPANTIRVRTSDGNVPIKGNNTTYETATLVAGTSDVYDVYKSGTSFNNLLDYSTNVIEVLGANTTNITSMNWMCSNCSNLTNIAIFNTSNVTDLSYMFNRCIKLDTVPLFNTSNVTNISWMFNGCSNLTSVPLFNTSNVTDMSFMFSSCPSLTSVPLFDTSNVTNMSNTFSVCNHLTAIPLFNTSKVTNMQSTFANCIRVESGALALYQQASTQTNPPTSHSYAFYDCGSYTTTGAAELAQIPSGWK